MKAMLLATLFCACLTAQAKPGPAEQTIPASDSRITYIGRTEVRDGSVSFDWSGTTAKVRFSGPYLALKCSDSGANWFNVYIDREADEKEDLRIKTCGRDTLIVITADAGKGVHEVIIQKRTEGEQGRVTFSSFICKGEFLQASPKKERHIEFIGDSYTCGYGTESPTSTETFRPETENCNLTYAAIASRYFDADFTLISHSGRGVVRNYNGGEPQNTMVDRFSRTFDNDTQAVWDFSRQGFTPDIVVIYLGANDFSTGLQPSKNSFTHRYIELLGKIHTAYGDNVPILCLAPKQNPDMFEYVKESCKRLGTAGVYYGSMECNIPERTSDIGADGHPNYSGHRKIAGIVATYIATITGWEMPLKPYK